MKNLIYISAILILAFSIGISYLTYKDQKNQNESKNILILTHLSQANEILNKQKKLPLPGGNLIYYSKNGEIKSATGNYDIISGRLCGKQFNNIGISLTDPYHQKCYKYSVTKDLSTFEIGGVIGEGNGYKTILTGNSNQSITKDYINDMIIANNDKTRFPYNPYTKYIGAKFIGAELKSGKLYVIDKNGKSKQLTMENYKDYDIQTFDTIILKGKNSSAYIKFENQDLLKINGNSIIKIQESEMFDEKSNNNIFWLVGNLTYNIYNSKNSSNINTPNQSIGIRGDILEGASNIQDNNYSISTKTYSGKNITQKNTSFKVQQIRSIESLFEDNNGLNADILNSHKIDIENIVKIDND